VAMSRRRASASALVILGVATAVLALFVPFWGISLSLNNDGATSSAALRTYLTGDYSFSTSTNTTVVTCPLSGGNASHCESLNATAHLYEAMGGQVVSGVVLGVVGLALNTRAPSSTSPATRKPRWGTILAAVGAAVILAAAVGAVFGQPAAFSADTPKGETGSPFGSLPSWCNHGPDTTFWAGCTATGPTEFIKWGPGLGWFLLLESGAVILAGVWLFGRPESLGPPSPAPNPEVPGPSRR
jgi:hypothetical protein